jgi:site-specific DNA recombinase
MKAMSVKPIRCAIYTRVSTDQGLDQEFNSLDAQHDASAAYIKSQVHAGWTLIKARYDDGGYSGGSTDRPALRRLLDDIRLTKSSYLGHASRPQACTFPQSWGSLIHISESSVLI